VKLSVSNYNSTSSISSDSFQAATEPGALAIHAKLCRMALALPGSCFGGSGSHSSIDNIVCFGLGPLCGIDGHETTRSLTQRAAAMTMAEELSRLRSSSISCYAQDPAYTDIDKQVLRSIGIMPINDPKGFLRVDRNTFVFSVSPNVPVKQIVSDSQWPQAMLWDTVQPERDEKIEWTKKIAKGRVSWIS
jgi:hypothetical protein